MNNIVTVTHELKEDEVFVRFEKTNRPSVDITVNGVRTVTRQVSDYVYMLLSENNDNRKAEARIILDTKK